MQWHKQKWNKDDIAFVGEIKIHPSVDKKTGDKTVKCTHPHLLDVAALDFSQQAAVCPETGQQMAHIHDGVVDHIRVLPIARSGGVSVHAVYHDKDGKVVRQDAHFQVDQPSA